MTAPAANDLLDRAAGMYQLADTIGSFMPAPAVDRASRLMGPFPADPGALRDLADDASARAKQLHAAAEELASSVDRAAGWTGKAANNARASATERQDRLRSDAAANARVSTVLDTLSHNLAMLRPKWDLALHHLQVSTGDLNQLGPLLPHLISRAGDRIRDGARVMRELHDVSDRAAQQLRDLMGTDAPAASTPHVTPDLGPAIPGVDPPPRGQSGVQGNPHHGFATIWLNPTDTDDAVARLGGSGSGAVVGAAVIPHPAVRALLGIYTGVAGVGTSLINSNRTPDGIRINLVDGRPVWIAGR